jgi:outer membrane protein assembly factor BamB
MGILLTLFVFQQGYADTTWLMYGGCLENTHYQKMVGAMETAPYVKWSRATGFDVECHGPAVADVDGDGNTEVIVGSCDNKVYCMDGVTGAVEWSFATGGYVYPAPGLGDVDGDGDMEVLVASLDHRVYCLNGLTGLVEWSYVTGDDMYISSPALVDIDGDMQTEIIIGSGDNKVYCFNGIGGTVKWSYTAGGRIWCSPAIGDVNGDDTMEVVVGSNDTKVYCLNGITGTVRWSYATGGWVRSAPAIADVDGVAGMEVVVGSNDNKVYCLNGVTGSVKWSLLTGHEICSSPAVVDVDEDGDVEVLIGSKDHKIYCLNGPSGVVEWSRNVGGDIHRAISVADLDGDIADECKLEVLVPNNDTDSLICLNGEDGSVLWIKELTTDIHDITIADIDDDGCVELVIGTGLSRVIWALDDVGNRSDCHCGPNDVEEDGESRSAGFHQDGIEFRATEGGIYLSSPNAVQVEISVHDVCGRLEQVLYKGVLSKGGHTFSLDVGSSGIYFVVLNVAGHSTSRGFLASLKVVRF